MGQFKDILNTDFKPEDLVDYVFTSFDVLCKVIGCVFCVSMFFTMYRRLAVLIFVLILVGLNFWMSNELKYKNETIKTITTELEICRGKVPENVQCNTELEATKQNLTDMTSKYESVKSELDELQKDPVMNRHFQIAKNHELVLFCLQQKGKRTTKENGEVVDEMVSSELCTKILQEYSKLNQISIQYVKGDSDVGFKSPHATGKDDKDEL